jgi:hypothetical protein
MYVSEGGWERRERDEEERQSLAQTKRLRGRRKGVEGGREGGRERERERELKQTVVAQRHKRREGAGDLR